jgi:hypothetical protein
MPLRHAVTAVDRDPLADIHNTRSIQAVVLNGRLFQCAALEGMLARAQTLASRELSPN